MSDKNLVRAASQIDGRRRELMKTSLFGAISAAMGTSLTACGGGDGSPRDPFVPDVFGFGALQPADANGIMLPAGFMSRIVAVSGETPLIGSGYTWHSAPDGGATFQTDDGGWIYVSNSEMAEGAGGVGALRFNVNAEIIEAYSILTGTTRNCAGGPTPWGTWLSCEEYAGGNVWECDPEGRFIPTQLRSLGTFQHEAAAVDPASGAVYLTEDRPDGRFYRFIPDQFDLNNQPDLRTGQLQVAEVVGGSVEGPVIWHDVPDADGVIQETKDQVPQSTSFDRGEGIWYDAGMLYMATAGDNRIWMYEISTAIISIVYDDDLSSNPILTGVDNITVSVSGDIYVAEDGGNLQLMLLNRNGEVAPVLQLVGHDNSEVTGPAFDPSGTRLYFSSQNGTTGLRENGITFEVSGPFLG